MDQDNYIFVLTWIIDLLNLRYFIFCAGIYVTHRHFSSIAPCAEFLDRKCKEEGNKNNEQTQENCLKADLDLVRSCPTVVLEQLFWHFSYFDSGRKKKLHDVVISVYNKSQDGIHPS